MANRSTGFLLAVELARLEAMAGGSTKIEAGHLLMGLTKLCRADIGEVLRRAGTVAQEVAGDALTFARVDGPKGATSS